MKKFCLFLCIAFFACACGEEPAPETPSEILVESIVFNKETISIHVTEEATLSADIKPSNAKNKNIKWSSSNPEIVELSVDGADDISATLKAWSLGEVTITAETEEGGKTATCVVTVPAAPVEGLFLKYSNSDEKVTVGKDENIVLLFSPVYATNKNLQLSSSDPDIVSVSDKVTLRGPEDPSYGTAVITVHGVSDGTATITAVTEDGGFKVEIPVESRSAASFGSIGSMN